MRCEVTVKWRKRCGADATCVVALFDHSKLCCHAHGEEFRRSGFKVRALAKKGH